MNSHDMILLVLCRLIVFSLFFPHHVVAESDLHEQAITVAFPAGRTTVEASIGINDDEIAESLEIFHLVLEIPEQATGNGVVAIAPNTTEIKIIDNDGMKWLLADMVNGKVRFM